MSLFFFEMQLGSNELAVLCILLGAKNFANAH